MIRFKRASDPKWIRRPAVYRSTGRVRSGVAEFKDAETGEKSEVDIGDKYTFDIRVENNGTTYKPAGKIAADAEALRVQIAGKLEARSAGDSAELSGSRCARAAQRQGHTGGRRAGLSFGAHRGFPAGLARVVFDSTR